MTDSQLMPPPPAPDSSFSRIAPSHLVTLGSALTGVSSFIKEMGSNAEGYATEGTKPFFNVDLVNEKDPKNAYLWTLSHSSFDSQAAVKMWDVGHPKDFVKKKHRAFNVGTWVASTKVEEEDEIDVIAATIDPPTKKGFVTRGFVGESGYMETSIACDLHLVGDGKNARFKLFHTEESKRNYTYREKLWKGTQWENSEFGAMNQSETAFCDMLFEHMGKHSLERGHACTMHVFTNLRSTNDETGAPRCFLQTTEQDIMMYYPDRAPQVREGFRFHMREHFMPPIRNLPEQAATDDMALHRQRLFQVRSWPVSLAAVAPEAPAGSQSPAYQQTEMAQARELRDKDFPPWCQLVAHAFNASGDNAKWFTKIYDVLKNNNKEAWCKSVPSGESTQKLIYDNYKNYSMQKVPTAAGVCVVHGDKVISDTPWSFSNGSIFMSKPLASEAWSSLANSWAVSGDTPTEAHIKKFFTVIGLPEADFEVNADYPVVRERHKQQNMHHLGVVSPLGGYGWLRDSILPPIRDKAPKLIDVQTLTIDETHKVVNYLNRLTGGAAGYGMRSVCVEMLGLNTSTIVQTALLPTPLSKEKLSERVNADLLYRDVMRVQTNSVLSKLTAGSAATMDNNRKAWKLYRADVETEKNNRILIQKGLEKAAQKGERAASAAQKVSEEAAAAIKKAADAEELAKKNTLAANAVIEKANAAIRKGKETEKKAAEETAAEKRARERAEKKAKDLEAQIKEEEALKKQDKEFREAKAARRKAGRTANLAGPKLSFPIGAHRVMREVGFPEDKLVAQADLNMDTDVYVRKEGYKDVAKNNTSGEIFAALIRTMDGASIRPGQKRKASSMLTGEMAIKFCEHICGDEALIDALCLTYNKEQTIMRIFNEETSDEEDKETVVHQGAQQAALAQAAARAAMSPNAHEAVVAAMEASSRAMGGGSSRDPMPPRPSPAAMPPRKRVRANGAPSPSHTAEHTGGISEI